MLRRLLEVIARNRVVKRRLPTNLGGRAFYASPDAALRYWLPGRNYDPLLLDVARKLVKPTMKVWDVGANVGLFSLAAAHLVGPSGFVLAIEPDPWLGSLLIRSSQTPARGAAPIQVLVAPVSDHRGITILHIAKRGRASNFIGTGRQESDGERYSIPVSTVTLDSLLESFPVPDLVKIDIEGMEYLALKGASELLKHRPIIFAEVAEPNRKPVESLLSGYRFLMTNMQPCPHVPFNLIAMPA